MRKTRSPDRKSTQILKCARADAGIPTDKEFAKHTGIVYDNYLKHLRKPETFSALQIAVIVSETDMDDKTLGDFFRAINKERGEK